MTYYKQSAVWRVLFSDDVNINVCLEYENMEDLCHSQSLSVLGRQKFKKSWQWTENVEEGVFWDGLLQTSLE